MSHDPEPQTQNTTSQADFGNSWNEMENVTGLSNVQSDLHAKSDRLRKFDVDCQDHVKGPPQNKPESWQFNDMHGHDIQDVEEKKVGCDFSAGFFNLESTIDSPVTSLTVDHCSHTDGDFFSISDPPVESQVHVDVRDSFVPCWSAASEKEKTSVSDCLSPPQRIPESFQRGSYMLLKSSKMGIPQRRSVGLQRLNSSVSWLPDGGRDEPARREIVSRVREVFDASVETRVGKSSGWLMTEELHFPSVVECEKFGSLSRQVSIPTTFCDVAEYKRVFIAALQG